MMKDWKTTASGAAMILGALSTVLFAISKGAITQEVITGAMTAILGGVGLIFASDRKPA
jgi:hypothetical protein